MSQRISRASACAIPVVLAASTVTIMVFPGCGNSSASWSRAQMWGRVTYDAKPLKDGAIIFVGADGKNTNWGAGRIDKDGRFLIRPYQSDTPIEAGVYRIFFRPPAPKFEPTRARRSSVEGREPSDLDEVPKVVPPPSFPLPEKFLSVHSSEVEFYFDGRPQRVDIDLTRD
jgi:hypothetical protein